MERNGENLTVVVEYSALVESIEDNFLRSIQCGDTRMSNQAAEAGEKVSLNVMVNNPSFSDVVLSCEDGVELYASRLRLSARCVVFKRMFTSGMMESNLEKVELPCLQSGGLLIVLHYLYTGSFRNFESVAQQSEGDDAILWWMEGLQAIHAANFLLLQKAQVRLWSLLSRDVFTPKFDRNILVSATRLSLTRDFVSAYGHDETCGGIVEPMSRELVRIMRTGWLLLPDIGSLSPVALEYFLKHTVPTEAKPAKANRTGLKGNKARRANKVDLEEYLRFRQIVVWCVCQKLEEEEAVQVVSTILPATEGALSLCKNNGDDVSSDRKLKTESDGTREKVLQIRSACDLAKFTIKFLPYVQLENIPPHLFPKCVECLDPSEVFRTLRLLPTSKLVRVLNPHN